MSDQGDLLHVVASDNISPKRSALGRALVLGSNGLMATTFLTLGLAEAGVVGSAFDTWRPALYAYLLWAICLCVAQAVACGEQGKRTLFTLPATLFVVAMVIFP